MFSSCKEQFNLPLAIGLELNSIPVPPLPIQKIQ